MPMTWRELLKEADDVLANTNPDATSLEGREIAKNRIKYAKALIALAKVRKGM